MEKVPAPPQQVSATISAAQYAALQATPATVTVVTQGPTTISAPFVLP
ncbi:MAG: hypothetical protein ABSD13_14260 [Candidatus Korobacteraceae bacterium]|jgi:hypothetical protein